MDEVEEDSGEALAVARKYLRGKQLTRENMAKALRHLIARGYDYDTAKSAVSELSEDCED